jgi:hypothetical protein
MLLKCLDTVKFEKWSVDFYSHWENSRWEIARFVLAAAIEHITC